MSVGKHNVPARAHLYKKERAWSAYWLQTLSGGARDGNRTHDLLITNQLLYRLSHSSRFYIKIR